ncbi:MAG: hypothetical protein ACYC2Y_07980 [Armatimonadota bacterium]
MFTRFTIHPGAPAWLWALGIACDFLIFGAVWYGLLMLVPGRYRKPIVMGATFLAGLIYSIEFFWPPDPATKANPLTSFTQELLPQIITVIGAFSLGLGILSLVRFHGKSLLRRSFGWHNNLAFFIAFIALALAGFWKEHAGTAWSSDLFDALFKSTIEAPGATMFAIVGFYIISAAYRAFRIRSTEATLMLVAAFVVMLGQVSIGAWITSNLPQTGIWSNLRLENITHWILSEPNMAAQRAIAFGLEVGAFAMALRTWLSLERGSFFDREM